MSGMQLLRAVLWLVGLVALLGINTLVGVYWERKYIGHIHWRRGPMHHGWHGLLQSLADMVKMLGKEDVVPSHADPIFFRLAPAIVFVPAYVALTVIPFAPGFALANIQHGVFFMFAVLTVMPIGFTLAGWACDNKFTLIGSLRAAAQLISYEIPMLLAGLGVVMAAGTMNLTVIGENQAAVWYVVTQPLGFVIFAVTMVAEMNRAPFDEPEAESELVAGYHTEFSGMKFGLVMLAEYGVLLGGCLLISMLFLGAWNMPFLPPSPIWLLVKTFALMTAAIWVRGTLPRIKVDTMMESSWHYLIPVALANLMIVGVLVLAFPKVF